MEKAKPKILFIAEAVTLAHYARLAALASSLDRNLYNVVFACDPRYEKFASKLADTTYVPISSISSKQFSEALAKGKPLYEYLTLKQYVDDDLLLLSAEAPDLVVGDFRLSLSISARLKNIFYMSLSNIYWSPYAIQQYPVPDIPITKIFGIGIAQKLFDFVRPAAFKRHTVPLNKLRKSHNLPALGLNLGHTYTDADLTLYADVPGLIETDVLPGNHRYLGPVLWSPPVALPFWWDSLDNGKKIIYITLGSSGQVKLLAPLVRNLQVCDAQLIVATVGHGSLKGVSDNVFQAEYIPGDLAAQKADLVICNGGSPTTQQALSYAKPVLGIPGNLDQHLNMQALVNFGVGQLVRSELLIKTDLKPVVNHLMTDNGILNKAQKLAAIYSKYNMRRRFNESIAEIFNPDDSK